jgi:hypothetical protein
MESNINMYSKTRQYAIDCHNKTNHFYDDNPYSFHLEMVESAALKYIALIAINDSDLYREMFEYMDSLLELN